MPKKQKSILLIEPPFYRLFRETYSLDRFPLSLAYLSGAIMKKTGWKVSVYNADFSPKSELMKVSYLAGEGFKQYLSCLKNPDARIWKEIKKTLEEYSPDVLGISVKSQNLSSALIIAKIAKKINSNIIVIAGGPHPSMVGKELLKCKNIDFGIIGEGEQTIVGLLKAIENGKNPGKIKGIVFRNGKKIIESEKRDFLGDLDSLPFPHETAPLTLKDFEKYPITAFENVFVTRGCPFSCSFCGSRKVWGQKVRFRSVENIIKEIVGLQKIGLKLIRFDDDIFGINKKFSEKLCNAIISKCRGMKWSCETHVNLVDEKTIALMKKAGCYSIYLGIESGNDRILSEIGKNITVKKAIEACEIIKRNGILLNTFFIVGFPQETEETLRDTVRLMKKIKSDNIVYSRFTPYPGSDSFELCKKNGLIGKNFDVSLFNHQGAENSFCIDIPPARFRKLAFEIEKMVDRMNSFNQIKQLFSISTINRIQEIGLRRSISTGVSLFSNLLSK